MLFIFIKINSRNIHSHFAVSVNSSNKPHNSNDLIKDKINKSLKFSAAKFETESASTTPRELNIIARSDSNKSSFGPAKSLLVPEVFSPSHSLLPEHVSTYFKHSTLITNSNQSESDTVINPFTQKPLDKARSILETYPSDPVIEDASSYFKFATPTYRKGSERSNIQEILDEEIAISSQSNLKAGGNQNISKLDITKMLELEIKLENERKIEREQRLKANEEKELINGQLINEESSQHSEQELNKIESVFTKNDLDNTEHILTKDSKTSYKSYPNSLHLISDVESQTKIQKSPR